MRESEPQTGQASSMSSAMPAAFWSAMSMTTTSASDLSATPRATVAPTLPAPPTTVTLRFMKRSSPQRGTQRPLRPQSLFLALRSLRALRSNVRLHVFDNSVSECRRLQLNSASHLPRQVVRDLLLADGLLEP